MSGFDDFLLGLGAFGRKALAVLVGAIERFDYIDYLFILLTLTILIVVHLWFRSQFMSRQIAWLQQHALRAVTIAEDGYAAGDRSPAAMELWVAVDRMDRSIKEVEAALQSLMSEQTGVGQELERLRTTALTKIGSPNLERLEQQVNRIDGLEQSLSDLRGEMRILRMARDRSETQNPSAPAMTPPPLPDLGPLEARIDALSRQTTEMQTRLDALQRQSEFLAERVTALDGVAANVRTAIRTLKAGMPPRVEGAQDLVVKLEQSHAELVQTRQDLIALAEQGEREKASVRETLERFVAVVREN